MQWTKKLVGNEDERAVSPVIGVILMVAITVILAAVIAAFVLDLGPSETDPQAAVNIDGDDTSEVTVELVSMDNADGIVVVSDDDSDAITDANIITVSGGSIVVGDGTGDVNGQGNDFDVVAFRGPTEAVTDSNNVVSDLDEESSLDIAIVDSFTHDSP